ncbi:hypothetical protein EB06_01195 [Enterococcus cecorum]|uniref:hypothetical protein n=1 Tax=Enterococcus cecorum TaxID=44008 RepID=UPI000DE8B170|nr:hypothetical protein [Enterococcus cecorum]RBR32311.1 hypothetical protein EB06_01195 [Enterococcus cecorum]
MDETQEWIDKNLLPDEEEGSGIYDAFDNELLVGEEVLVTGDDEYIREDDLWDWFRTKVEEETDLEELAKMVNFLIDDHALALAIESLMEIIFTNFKNKDVIDYYDLIWEEIE